MKKQQPQGDLHGNLEMIVDNKNRRTPNGDDEAAQWMDNFKLYLNKALSAQGGKFAATEVITHMDDDGATNAVSVRFQATD